MKILIITNLFPNAHEPNRSPFNFQQFSALAKLCDIKIVAPVPCFKYSLRQVPYLEKIAGIEVFHPRYLVIPKILRFTHALTFFLGIWHTLTTIRRSFDYDVILAAWAYPDAVAASRAARLLKKKFFVKVHGSDINLAHQYWGRVGMIRKALQQADGILAVSNALKQKMVLMGVPEQKVLVIQNGVDKDKFYPRDKKACREKFGLDKAAEYILYVGNFSPVKGVSYLLKAFALLIKTYADVRLLLIGDGEEHSLLMSLARDLGIADKVSFMGRRPYDDIPELMNAADVFCLPSLNEGCPNVLLEAMACGMKVVASNVGGVPDIIGTADKGWTVRPKDPGDLAAALKLALQSPISSKIVSVMSWDENAQQVFRLFTGTH